jgi:hypothetical protein
MRGPILTRGGVGFCRAFPVVVGFGKRLDPARGTQSMYQSKRAVSRQSGLNDLFGASTQARACRAYVSEECR